MHDRKKGTVNRMKRKLLCLLICAAILMTALATFSFADFGDFGGDADYGDGGLDFGGGDYDNGYDRDDDWGDDLGGIYFLGGGFGGGSSNLIIWIIVILVIIYFVRRSKRSQRPSGTPNVQMNNGATGLRPISEYHDLDPLFSEEAIAEKLSNLYVRMQNMWTAGNIDELRPYFTDAQFNQYKSQLDRMKADGLTNVVERITVLETSPLGFSQSGENDRIVYRLRSRITDYTVDKSGNVVKGSKTAEKFMTYEYDLIRPKGTLTSEHEKESVHNCPNCGAPLDVNHTAKCPYCDSIITVNDYDWTVSAIRGISQQTVGN